MRKYLYLLSVSLTALLLLAACGGGSEPAISENETAVTTNSDEMMEDEQLEEASEEADSIDEEMAEEEHMDEEMMDEDSMDEEMAEEESMDEEMMDEDSMDEEMMEEEETAVSDFSGPEWLTLPLTDSRTGDSFTLADFAGKTVYVEPMATWCTNCRRQLNTVSAGMDQIPEDAVLIGLSVESNLQDNVLANYANNNGYDFLFAVATPELIEAMVGEYGRSVTTPPSTPHFIIRPDGTLTELSTGFHTIEEIVSQIESESQ